MSKVQQSIALCLVLITMSLSASALPDNDKKKNKKGKKHKVEVGHRHNNGDDDNHPHYYYETREEYEARRNYYSTRKTWTTECRERNADVERHARQIVRAETRASNMSGPVSVTSVITTCGPGSSVTIAARTLVGTQWYTFKAELRPTGKNPNSPEGWTGFNRVWERRSQPVVIQTPAPTAPTPTTTQRRPSR